MTTLYLDQKLPKMHKRKYLSHALIQKPYRLCDHALLQYVKEVRDLALAKMRPPGRPMPISSIL